MIKILLLSFVTLYIFWLILNFFLLITKNLRVINDFKKLESLLNKRYGILDNMMISDDNKKYLEELKSLPKGIKYLNRKLALNYILSKTVNESLSDENLPDEYKIVNAELANIGEIYNKDADILKRAVEIFPKSFYARFLNIKSVDYYRG
ncbi:hypothetical protein IKQ21_07675 [bacterium]|nr:hypothetical protein [bacterium]